jgi:tRNA pseudouridine55 synthase
MTTISTDGAAFIDKPRGITSHDVVAVVRRALGTRRIGHTGTLDPFATGLLILLVGRATRLNPFVAGEPKGYEAVIRFGAETDTDDDTGTVIRTAQTPVMSLVREKLPVLTGRVMQTPPAYSAKQVGGRRAYVAAREGAPLELAPVEVRVDRWEILATTDDAIRVYVECGAGTYIRALARDLGRLTGSAAHLAELRRVRLGNIAVGMAQTLDQVRDGGVVVHDPLSVLGTIARRTLTPDEQRDVAHGRAVGAQGDDASSRAALLDDRGALVAIGEREHTSWQPRVVMVDA